MISTCSVCGKQFEGSEGASLCSLRCMSVSLCRRFKDSGCAPPPRPRKAEIKFNFESIPKCDDNSVPVSIFCKTLDSLNIEYTRDFFLDDMQYDLYLPQTHSLVCINPTLTSNIYALGRNCRIQRDRSNIAIVHDYRCVHIFDWDDQFKIAVSLQPRKKLHARKLELIRLSKQESYLFLNMFDYSGAPRYAAVVSYGLVSEGSLIQVLVMSKSTSRNTEVWNLSRICSVPGYQVVGGASKLFNQFLVDFNPNEIVSFCDTAKFGGRCLENLGFSVKTINMPQKMWSKGIDVIPDVSLSGNSNQIRAISSYQFNKPVAQVMLEDGWIPIYDCGRTKYIWTKPN